MVVLLLKTSAIWATTLWHNLLYILPPGATPAIGDTVEWFHPPDHGGSTPLSSAKKKGDYPMKQILTVDVETRSVVDIKKCGMHRYIEDDSFRILLNGYALHGQPPTVLDLTQSYDDYDFRQMLHDPSYLKVAHNSGFERNSFLKHYGKFCDPAQWIDTQVMAAYCGLPLALGQVTTALGFGEDKAKDTKGKALIRFFSCPRKPTAKNPSVWNEAADFSEKWEEYIEYNRQDVVAEEAVYDALVPWMPPDAEWVAWQMDQQINDRGIRIDMGLAKAASEMGRKYKVECLERAKELTGLDNPNSQIQLKNWLQDAEGIEVESLNKKELPRVVQSLTTDKAKELLSLRDEFSKAAGAKYDAMLRSVCSDGHVKGCFKFGGTHTMRWAGQLVQLQNLKRNALPDLDSARRVVKSGELATLEMLYPSVTGTLGELVRTALLPEEECRFIVSDFSAIEARVVAWLAGEQWVLDAFAAGKDIYCEIASQMFGVPVIKHGENGELRQLGKIALLGCGYGGGPNALLSFGADKMGMDEAKQKDTVDRWRASNPSIVKFWSDTERCAIRAILGQCTVRMPQGRLSMTYDHGNLWINLPSGRAMCYWGARYDESRWKPGRKVFSYMGLDQQTKRFNRIESWGGKMVENVTQAVARDILRDKIVELDKRGFDVRAHVHDEVIVSVPIGESSAKEVSAILGEQLPWTEGLPLKAEGYECEYYMKD